MCTQGQYSFCGILHILLEMSISQSTHVWMQIWTCPPKGAMVRYYVLLTSTSSPLPHPHHSLSSSSSSPGPGVAGLSLNEVKAVKVVFNLLFQSFYFFPREICFTDFTSSLKEAEKSSANPTD